MEEAQTPHTSWKQTGYKDLLTHETQKETALVLPCDRKNRVQSGKAVSLSVDSSSLKTKAAATKPPSNAGFMQTCPCYGFWPGIFAFPSSLQLSSHLLPLLALCLLYIFFLISPKSCLHFLKRKWNWIFFKSGFLRKQVLWDLSGQ